MYELGLIGNCQVSAVVTQKGSIDWLCFPHLESDPVFGRILDPEGGHFNVTVVNVPEERIVGRQHYLENTNILITDLFDQDKPLVRITDFCPRFEQYGRMYRPASVYRIVEPLASGVEIRVNFKPVNGWKKEPVRPIRGNSHLRYEMRGDAMRLITTMPLTLLSEGGSILLKEKIYFGLSWSFGIEDDLSEMIENHLRRTKDYWLLWVKHCQVPSEFQKETIRSALALKLHVYEDTGAILAATTTSLPEEEGGVRNWDYRYCWVRDSFFTLSAFHSLGHFEEMEGYLKFILNIVGKHVTTGSHLGPVFALDHRLPLPEILHDNWAGYNGSAPVRSANQAAEHVQNDVYGELVLTLAPLLFDERFVHMRTPEVDALLAYLGQQCIESIGQKDAGLWELREGWQEHTFSNLLSWAGLERLGRLSRMGKFKFDSQVLAKGEAVAAEAVRKGVKDGTLRSGPTDPSFDTSLCLAAILRFPEPEVLKQTLQTLDHELTVKGHPEFFYRYRKADDFGTPKSAFLACSFWMAQAYAKIGNKERARQIVEKCLGSANSLGLFSEHFDPRLRSMLGNFPQAYSHVGLINSAFAISPPWDDVL